jgi:hypothetical protein
MIQLFHITKTANLKSIMKNGLIPTIGIRSKKIDERSSIYFFQTQEDAENGLMNWLGDEFEEDESLALLKITLPLSFPLKKDPLTDAWEINSEYPIQARNIEIINRNI